MVAAWRACRSARARPDLIALLGARRTSARLLQVSPAKVAVDEGAAADDLEHQHAH
jgi:hypothetical protein